MLRGLLHNTGADGLCEECGEPFPCPLGMAIFEAVKAEVLPDQVHLMVTRDELATLVSALRSRGLHGFADRLEALLHRHPPD